ncbi:MAG: 50S ribosomal protein L18 [Bacilli bacterium]|jgi:large subunit ribosomal protein L18|nr:50S ribosomal protein L18 [Bacilli bacterium]
MFKIIDKNGARLHRHLRQKSKIHGTASRPRVSVFRSNRQIYAQIVDDDARKTLAEANSQKMGLTDGATKEGATKVGAELAKKAKELGITEIVFDRSGYIYHGRVQALADAMRQGGLKF